MKLSFSQLIGIIFILFSEASYSGIGDLILKMQVKKLVKEVKMHVKATENALAKLDEEKNFLPDKGRAPEFYLATIAISAMGNVTFGIPGISTYTVNSFIAISWRRIIPIT